MKTKLLHIFYSHRIQDTKEMIALMLNNSCMKAFDIAIYFLTILIDTLIINMTCLLYTSPSPRDP